jgi:Fe-S oxidoreductase
MLDVGAELASAQGASATPVSGPHQVLLWPDTFTNHFHPEVGEAAVEVLEALGYEVAVPAAALCCGRPLYDFGMLRVAKRLLRRALVELREEIRAGTPVVVLEPSCAAVFRDELVNLLPHDEDARRLAKQTVLLPDLLARDGTAPRNVIPSAARDLGGGLRGRKALLHGHCHQKAILGGTAADEAVLARLGVDLEVLDAGCCGMAGSFGFEAGERYEVSMRCGERVLLPAVRAAAGDTLLIADGFSCREQIAQATGRRALHLAQVLQMALAVRS